MTNRLNLPPIHSLEDVICMVEDGFLDADWFSRPTQSTVTWTHRQWSRQAHLGCRRQVFRQLCLQHGQQHDGRIRHPPLGWGFQNLPSKFDFISIACCLGSFKEQMFKNEIWKPKLKGLSLVVIGQVKERAERPSEMGSNINGWHLHKRCPTYS